MIGRLVQPLEIPLLGVTPPPSASFTCAEQRVIGTHLAKALALDSGWSSPCISRWFTAITVRPKVCVHDPRLAVFHGPMGPEVAGLQHPVICSACSQTARRDFIGLTRYGQQQVAKVQVATGLSS